MQKIIIGLAPNVTVEVAGDNVKQLIEQASFWNSLPHLCPLCNAPLVFFHRLTQGDDSYWGQACTGNPVHEANFGVYKKEERGFYYKGDWQKAYDAYQNAGGGRGDDFTGGQSIPPNDQTNPANRAPVGNPVAQNLGDMVTGKQLGMIRALAREKQIDPEVECKARFNLDIDELSKRAASDLIEHLQQTPKQIPIRTVSETSTPTATIGAAPSSGPALVNSTVPEHQGRQFAGPVIHPSDCDCPNCDIPF